MTTIDPRQIKTQVKKAWDGSAAGMKKWATLLGEGGQPVTDALLDLAGVAEGTWVLDVAAGHGDPALAAAKRVGPAGKVVAIDLSKRMLTVAEERAKAAKLGNITFQEVDAEALGSWPEKSYDAVLCRFGLMFMPQLQIALSGIHRVLTTGSAFATSVWAAEERMPLLGLATQVVGEVISLPRPAAGSIGGFSLSEPGVLEQAMSSVGFRAIRGERVTVVYEFPTAASYVDFVKEASHLASTIAEQGPHAHEQIAAGLLEAATARADAEGKVSFICDANCVVGKRG